jgi:hypothetical protein
VLADADVAHTGRAIEVVSLVAAGAAISAMLRTGRCFVKDPMTTHTLVGYADAIFQVETLVAVRAQRTTIYRTERTGGPNPLLASALIGHASRVFQAVPLITEQAYLGAIFETGGAVRWEAVFTSALVF